MQNFDLIAIVELGSGTFGATGTNTIILFLRKKSNYNATTPKYYDDMESYIESGNLLHNEFYKNHTKAYETYCDFRGFEKGAYESFLNGNLDSKLLALDAFKDYHTAFIQTSDYKKLLNSKAYKDSKDKEALEHNAFLAYAREIEKEKLLYFCLSLNQAPLIIKAPNDNKEQKKFLGYEWSNKKGNEGIKELHSPYLSPLFERDNPHNENKLAYLICQAFLKTTAPIPQDLATYAFKARLIDMLDFSKVEFNKAISLNPLTNRQKIASKFPLVKLQECGNFFMGGTPSRKISSYWNGNIKWLTIGDYQNHQIIMDTQEKITEQGFKESNAKMIPKGAVVVSIYATIGRVGILGEDMTTNQAIVSIVPNNEFTNKYLMYVIDYFKFQLFDEVITTSQKNVNLNILQNMKIPKPDIAIQKQIVEECEKIEEQYKTIRMSIEKYQELIKAVLIKAGIITESNNDEFIGGGGETSRLDSLIASLLDSIKELESKLDYELLFSCHSEGATATEESLNANNKDISLSLNMTKGRGAMPNTNDLKALLDSIPTPPPQGWDTIKLNNKKYLTLNPSKKEIANIDENTIISFVEMASVADKGYIQNKVNKSLKELRRGSYTYFAENDILIAKITPCMENGKCAIAKNLTNGLGMGSSEFHIFRTHKGLNHKFLFTCLNQDSIRQEAVKNMTGSSGHKRVPISFYESLTIPLPPLEAQEKIINAIESVESQIAHIDSKLETLEKRKAEILNNALNNDNERENRQSLKKS